MSDVVVLCDKFSIPGIAKQKKEIYDIGSL